MIYDAPQNPFLPIALNKVGQNITEKRGRAVMEEHKKEQNRQTNIVNYFPNVLHTR